MANANDVSKSGKHTSAFRLQYGHGAKKVRHVCEKCRREWDLKRDWKKCCKDIGKY